MFIINTFLIKLTAYWNLFYENNESLMKSITYFILSRGRPHTEAKKYAIFVYITR